MTTNPWSPSSPRGDRTGDTAIFLVNRSLDEEVEIVVDTSILGDVRITSTPSLWDDDIHAANTMEQPDRVALRPNESARIADGALRMTLPPVSWTAVSVR